MKFLKALEFARQGKVISRKAWVQYQWPIYFLKNHLGNITSQLVVTLVSGEVMSAEKFFTPDDILTSDWVIISE